MVGKIRHLDPPIHFTTVLGEGLEAAVFIAGVSFSLSVSVLPLLIPGGFVGWLLYK
jgi:hypothetical protein